MKTGESKRKITYDFTGKAALVTGGAALWLCSDEASFVLGHTLPVDGGMTIT